MTMTEANNNRTLADRFSCATTMSCPRKFIAMNQGMPRPNRISKTFDPMALLTAISPRPCLATTIEPIKSGTLVPAAKTVNPKKVAFIDSASAMFTMPFTSTQLIPAMAAMDITKVIGYARGLISGLGIT